MIVAEMKMRLIMTLIKILLPFLIVIAIVIPIGLTMILGGGGTIASGDDIAGHGLPSFITVEMMEALFETQVKHGIPVSTGVAMIIAEGGFGIYGPGGEVGQGLSRLSYDYHNLFGIKYWSGMAYATGSVNMATGEQTTSGDTYHYSGRFAVFSSYSDSIYKRAWMLMRSPYFPHLEGHLNQNDDRYTIEQANAFMHGIRAGGWATDLAYVEKNIRHMEFYNLYRFDNMTFQEFQSMSVVVGTGRFAHPCPAGILTSPFGWRRWDDGRWEFHNGADFGAPTGTPIYAADSGIVITSGFSVTAGNWIVINHGNGYVTKYMHNSKNLVSVNQVVVRGEEIAHVGNTGYSFGAHLHFQVERHGVPVDPMPYLR